jgi:uncharacterized membrane protein YbaN (DUF454 family)
LVYSILGFVFLGLGLVGIVLPLIPTTGPVLLAAFFFARSSTRFHAWLVDHPRFGPGIRDYQAGLGITLRAKLTAVAMIALTFGLSMTFVVRAWQWRALLVATAAGIVWFILSRPTCARRRTLDPAATDTAG